MKIAMMVTLFLTLISTQALGFGLVLEGTGQLALDDDMLHGPDQYDYDQDGAPDLIQVEGPTFRVLGLDGSILWTATVDTLEICPTCPPVGTYWDFGFYGFFQIEPGERNAGVDLDGDGFHELVLWVNPGNSESAWEVWGNQPPVGAPAAVKRALRVEQNHPNPFNPATTVRF